MFPDDLSDCDGIILVTAHSQYRDTAIEQFVQPGTVIVDNFGAWRGRRFAPGVRYHEVGRPGAVEGADTTLVSEPQSQFTG
jgi:UDP-N-acetyl-D-mannosaminuronate dehydrogenase